MDAPKLAWFGNEPVIVGDAVPDHPDGHVSIWRFVSGSAADAHPDFLDYGADAPPDFLDYGADAPPDFLDYGAGEQPRRSSTERQADQDKSAGRVLDFSGVGTAGSEPGNVPAQSGATAGDVAAPGSGPAANESANPSGAPTATVTPADPSGDASNEHGDTAP